MTRNNLFAIVSTNETRDEIYYEFFLNRIMFTVTYSKVFL